MAGGLTRAGGTEPVGTFLTIIGEDVGDVERRLIDQTREEALGGGGGLVRVSLDINPASGPVEGGEPGAALILVGPLGEGLDVHLDKAGPVCLERFVGGSGACLLGPQGLEVGPPVAAQAAVQAGAGDRRVEELPPHHQEVLQGPQPGLAQRHPHDLLGRGAVGLPGVRAMRAIGAVLAVLPLAHPVPGEGIPAGPCFLGQGRFAQFLADRWGGSCILRNCPSIVSRSSVAKYTSDMLRVC